MYLLIPAERVLAIAESSLHGISHLPLFLAQDAVLVINAYSVRMTTPSKERAVCKFSQLAVLVRHETTSMPSAANQATYQALQHNLQTIQTVLLGKRLHLRLSEGHPFEGARLMHAIRKLKWKC